MNGRRLISRSDAFPAGRRPHRTRASGASRSVPPEISPEIARSPRRTRRRVTRGVDRPVTLAPPASRVRPAAHAPATSPHRGRRRGRVARRRRSECRRRSVTQNAASFSRRVFWNICIIPSNASNASSFTFYLSSPASSEPPAFEPLHERLHEPKTSAREPHRVDFSRETKYSVCPRDAAT